MEPIRSCIACRSQENWKELLHLVQRDGRVIPDPTHRLGGRGAWLHPKCFEVAKNRRSFNRAFKSDGDLSLHELEEYLRKVVRNVHPERSS